MGIREARRVGKKSKPQLNMALKMKQVASMLGAAVVIGIIAVYKDVFRSWFTEKPRPEKKDSK